MVDIDTETLFNGAAAAVATLAVLFFLLNLDYPYSPVTEYGLAFAFVLGVFAVTQRTGDYQLALFGYASVLVSLLALFFEVVGTFELGDLAVVVGLLVIAVALFAARSLLDEESRFVSGRAATYAFGALSALVVLLLVVDVATGGLSYELQVESEVEIVGVENRERDRDGARLGEVVVDNPTPLPEAVDVPRFEVCAVGNWSEYRIRHGPDERPEPVRLHLQVDRDYNDHVFGYGSTGYPVVLHGEVNASGGATFPVERTGDCPDDESGDPYVAVFQVPDDRRYYAD